MRAMSGGVFLFGFCGLSFFCFLVVHGDCNTSKSLKQVELEKKLSRTKTSLNLLRERLEKVNQELREWQRIVSDEATQETMEISARDVSLDTEPEPAAAALPSLRACLDEARLRLVNGPTELAGRLEVKEGDFWTTVCEDGWNQQGAQIVCAMLGYTGKDVAAVGSRVFGHNDAIGVLPASGSCSAPAGAICGGIQNYSVRVSGGAGSYEGLVELQVNGQWGYLCDGDLDTREASVICRMLGFTGDRALATHNGFFGNGTGLPWGHDFECSGDEDTILSCGGVKNGTYLIGHRATCPVNDAAGVICDNFHRYPVRLVGGNLSHEGRVEVHVHNHWLQVYGDYTWDQQDANVVCRQLGFAPTDAFAAQDSWFGSGNGEAELGHFHCRGDELHLLACPMSYGLNAEVWHVPDNIAGVVCRPN